MYALRTSGPLGRQHKWGQMRHPGDTSDGPLRPPREVLVLAPAPRLAPPPIDDPVIVAMKAAIASRPASDATERLARQVALVILAHLTGSHRQAARALDTLPEAVAEARKVLNPIIARNALELRAAPACFDQLFALAESTVPHWDIGSLMLIVVQQFGVSESQIKSPRRLRRIVRARHCLIWLVGHFTSYSLPQIGRALGGRDHTTILHSNRLIGKAIALLGIDGGDDPAEWARLLDETLPENVRSFVDQC